MPLVTVVASNGAGLVCDLRVALYRSGCIHERWAVRRVRDWVYISGDHVGVVATGRLGGAPFCPVNPSTGTEYFKIAGSDLAPALEALGGALCFETRPDLAPLNPHEASVLQARIDAARSQVLRAQVQLRALEIERLTGMSSAERIEPAGVAADAAADQVHARMNAAVAKLDVPRVSTQRVRVSYEVSVGDRTLSGAVDGVPPSYVEATLRTLRRALAGKA